MIFVEKWQVLSHTNNVFELESVENIQKKEGHDSTQDAWDDNEINHKLSFGKFSL